MSNYHKLPEGMVFWVCHEKKNMETACSSPVGVARSSGLLRDFFVHEVARPASLVLSKTGPRKIP